jgi:hypothetical protein
LICLGSLIFRILGQVGIISNRFLNPLNKARSVDPDAILQLACQSRMTWSVMGNPFIDFCLGDEVAMLDLAFCLVNAE